MQSFITWLSAVDDYSKTYVFSKFVEKQGFNTNEFGHTPKIIKKRYYYDSRGLHRGMGMDSFPFLVKIFCNRRPCDHRHRYDRLITFGFSNNELVIPDDVKYFYQNYDLGSKQSTLRFCNKLETRALMHFHRYRTSDNYPYITKKVAEINPNDWKVLIDERVIDRINLIGSFVINLNPKSRMYQKIVGLYFAEDGEIEKSKIVADNFTELMEKIIEIDGCIIEQLTK